MKVNLIKLGYGVKLKGDGKFRYAVQVLESALTVSEADAFCKKWYADAVKRDAVRRIIMYWTGKPACVGFDRANRVLMALENVT